MSHRRMRRSSSPASSSRSSTCSRWATGSATTSATVVIDGQPIEYAAFVAPALLAATPRSTALSTTRPTSSGSSATRSSTTPCSRRRSARGHRGRGDGVRPFRGLIYAVGFFTVILALGLSSRGGRCSRCPRRSSSASPSPGGDRRSHLHAQLAGLRHPQPRPAMFLFSATFFPLSTYPAGSRRSIR